MDSAKPFLPLLCLLIILLIATIIQLAEANEYDDNNPPFYCPNTTTTTFAPNSTYHTNLNHLFSLLSSYAINLTDHDNGYYITAFTETGYDTVYGLFLCRGDVSAAACEDCVSTATKQALQQCPNQTSFTVWYDTCMLRYSDQYLSSYDQYSFLSTDQQNPIINISIYDTANVSEQSGFMDVLRDTTGQVADDAANSGGGKKFATKEANLSDFSILYALAQCMPDLLGVDCSKCLEAVIGYLTDCCYAKRGVKIFTTGCFIRYDLSPFYQLPSPPPSLTPKGEAKQGLSRVIIIVVVVVIVFVVVLLSCFAYYLRRKMSRNYKAILKENFGNDSTTLESLQLSLATIEAATNKFSLENKIGKGGFGEVYKGILSDGREIAVKRLSRNSGQGAIEFKNEILLIAKLQHRNLVALLGFCLEEKEKMLVYEYVSNKSLDYFLFGSQKKRILSWQERYKIIGGTARGILYLHEHSRLKIIHRDLKPSNILLDNEMNPKISDFGMAKMVAINEVEGNTNRIVGTYGYMSPEYAMLGQYSEKSDVFSFGVIILEMVSGKKTTRSGESQYVDSLLSYAWKQWRDGNFIEILDSNIRELDSYDEVIKCIQIGLLCVQENPDVRPSITTIVSYLSNDSIQLPNPQEPAFFMHGRMEQTIGEKESSSSDQYSNNSYSVNEMSISKFFPR